MNILAENQIKKFISDRSIKERTVLSKAFNMQCDKISLTNNEIFVAKFYQNTNKDFNSIQSEIKSLVYLSNIFPSLFPTIKFKSKNLVIMNYIKHNNIKKKNYQKLLAREILKIHSIANGKYGFNFDAQIGGIRQLNRFNSSWVNFFLNNRLNMIFEKINKENPMPKFINLRIQKLMKNINHYIPEKPRASLLHGDLWEGNILFNNGKLVGLIDPGIYFGHNEFEIAYLTWFKYIDDKFLSYYSNEMKIDSYFNKYEPIYQLYFSLLNIYLWNRNLYIKDTNFLLNKIFKNKD